MKSIVVALMLMMVSGSVCAGEVVFQTPGVPTKEEKELVSRMFNSITNYWPVPKFREGLIYVDTNFHAAMLAYGLTNAVRELAQDGTICRVLGHRWGESNQLGHISFSYEDVRYDGALIRRCIVCDDFQIKDWIDQPCKTCGQSTRVLGEWK